MTKPKRNIGMEVLKGIHEVKRGEHRRAPAKATRKQLSKKLRFEVFKRDSFKCQYCGSAAPKGCASD